jgi:peptidoglycan/xylan/chitin deacetylase (PgdA/CDA1 family)
MNLDYQRLLQGKYEEERLTKDLLTKSIVPDFAFNFLNPLGLLYKPVIDEHFLNNEGKKPTWPEGKSFAICLTHDVDIVYSFYFKQSLRNRKAQLLNNSSLSSKVKGFLGPGVDLFRYAKKYMKKDPLHCYEKWLKVEKEIGAHSTFFFWPGISSVTKKHHTDCNYELSDQVIFYNQKCTVADMIYSIDRRGWEIGLHPSWYSFNDADEVKRQKERIEKVLDHEIVSVRQHRLHYDIRITPQVHAEAGFRYDSTLGFNDNVGFRFGTCYPWYLYNLKEERPLPIMEIPLIIQDGALLNQNKGMRLDIETAYHYMIQIAEAVEKVGGILNLLWHPNYIIKEDWWNLYIRILKYLKQKNVWFASVKDIGDWWKKSSNKSLQNK